MNKSEKSSPDKKSYTVTEIQQMLGVSRPTAYKLIKQNVFQSIRVNNSIRIIKVSFDAWLDSKIHGGNC
ncbi:helix-turn-helix domain-containing protein [Murimonas intestini]|uniref:helix-turn-helix domain-containing protein n=1 Tax=Murimonas intestini TaxID=1337051 RepID=UPI0011DCE6C9|nr:helix-turn-helix domain-containing protein [Murimonas intestini]